MEMVMWEGAGGRICRSSSSRDRSRLHRASSDNMADMLSTMGAPWRLWLAVILAAALLGAQDGVADTLVVPVTVGAQGYVR